MSLVLPLFTESASKRLSNSVPHPWNVVSVVIMVASFMFLRIDAVFCTYYLKKIGLTKMF